MHRALDTSGVLTGMYSVLLMFSNLQCVVSYDFLGLKAVIFRRHLGKVKESRPTTVIFSREREINRMINFLLCVS